MTDTTHKFGTVNVTAIAELLRNAAFMLELDAAEWRERPAPDHLGRDKSRMNDVASANSDMAQHMRSVADEIES